MARNSGIEFELDAVFSDVEDVVSELKRVQREARKATQYMAELKRVSTEAGDYLADVPTNDLLRELARREGVETFEIDPTGAEYATVSYRSEDSFSEQFFVGEKAVIAVVKTGGESR